MDKKPALYIDDLNGDTLLVGENYPKSFEIWISPSVWARQEIKKSYGSKKKKTEKQ
jgi:hypothetical protein